LIVPKIWQMMAFSRDEEGPQENLGVFQSKVTLSKVRHKIQASSFT